MLTVGPRIAAIYDGSSERHSREAAVGAGIGAALGFVLAVVAWGEASVVGNLVQLVIFVGFGAIGAIRSHRQP